MSDARALRLAALLVLVLSSAFGCSRERVESIELMNEGITYAAQKQYPRAVEKLQLAAEVDDTNHEALWNLAIVHIQMDEPAMAREDLQRAIAVEPSIPGYHEKLGTVLMQLETPDYEAAREAFEAALTLDENLVRSRYRLAQVEERLDHPQEALEQYTRAIQTSPRFVDAYAALGRMYADLGYEEEAVQVLEGGLEVVRNGMEGTQDEAELHNLLGSVHQQMGGQAQSDAARQQHYRQAVESFEEALRILPDFPDSLFGLGWTYSLLNEREEARRYLQRYVEAASGTAEEHYVRAARDKLNELNQP